MEFSKKKSLSTLCGEGILTISCLPVCHLERKGRHQSLSPILMTHTRPLALCSVFVRDRPGHRDCSPNHFDHSRLKKIRFRPCLVIPILCGLNIIKKIIIFFDFSEIENTQSTCNVGIPPNPRDIDVVRLWLLTWPGVGAKIYGREVDAIDLGVDPFNTNSCAILFSPSHILHPDCLLAWLVVATPLRRRVSSSPSSP